MRNVIGGAVAWRRESSLLVAKVHCRRGSTVVEKYRELKLQNLSELGHCYPPSLRESQDDITLRLLGWSWTPLQEAIPVIMVEPPRKFLLLGFVDLVLPLVARSNLTKMPFKNQ